MSIRFVGGTRDGTVEACNIWEAGQVLNYAIYPAEDLLVVSKGEDLRVRKILYEEETYRATWVWLNSPYRRRLEMHLI